MTWNSLKRPKWPKTLRNLIWGGKGGYLVPVCIPIRDFPSVSAKTERNIQLWPFVHWKVRDVRYDDIPLLTFRSMLLLLPKSQPSFPIFFSLLFIHFFVCCTLFLSYFNTNLVLKKENTISHTGNSNTRWSSLHCVSREKPNQTHTHTHIYI